MADTAAPSGWYPDPAGGGGQRYWDGARWTQQVRAKSGLDQARAAVRRSTSATTSSLEQGRRHASEERLPDGYMQLNGKRVPLGQLSAAAATPPSVWRNYLAVLVVVSVITVLVVLLALG